MKARFLVTGVAGFIGFHICKELLEEGYFVIGLDNLNNYYDVNLKKARLNELKKKSKSNFLFIKTELEDKKFLKLIFKKHKPQKVLHFAAQAGVRYSIENPSAYINSNLLGFGNILESCRNYPVEHLIYASSSSIYGGNKKIPFSEKDPVNSPISLYAATKKANELMAHSYSHIYKIPTTGLRFFTVYGPWGRPDMAPMIFTKSILSDKPINVFNKGDMARDFTYIDDVKKAVLKLINKIPEYSKNINSNESINIEKQTPYRIINVGNNKPVSLIRFIEVLENELQKKAIKRFEEIQPGDVKTTFADISLMKEVINFEPKTPIEIGLKEFVSWYRSFYRI